MLAFVLGAVIFFLGIIVGAALVNFRTPIKNTNSKD